MKTKLLFSFATFFLCSLINTATADWLVVNTGLSDKNINDLAVNGSSVFAATEAGVFRSTDAGASWQLLSAPQYAKALVVKGADIYAAIQDGANGVMKSSDNGSTWVPVNTGLLYKYNDALAVDGSNIYAHDYGANAYVSADDGATWTQVASLPGFSTIVRNGAVLCAGYSIGGNGYNGIYTSSDNGTTWTQAANAGLTEMVNELAVAGTTLFATAGDGMYKSNDNGATWTYHTPVNGNDVDNAVTMAVSGANLFVGTPKGVFLSTDNGTSYTNVSGIIGTQATVAFTILGSTIFAGTVFNANGIYKREISEMTGGTTSFMDINNNYSISIFPNPSTGNFVFNSRTSNAEISVFNMVGEKIYCLQFTTGSSTIDLSNYPKGIYLVQVKEGEKIFSSKMIVE